MLEATKDLLVEFAKGSPFIQGVVLLGSFAVKLHTDTSDLDILFILKSEVNIKEYQLSLSHLFHRLLGEVDGNSFEIKSIDSEVFKDSKTIIYITCVNNQNLKIDCDHAFDVMEKAKFIVGSEIKLHHLNDIILLDFGDCQHDTNKELASTQVFSKKTIKSGCIFKQLHKLLSSVNPYSSSGLIDSDPLFHLRDFVEIFENCCCNFEKNDVYRIQFHLFILRHHLISLELLLKLGINEHVYLPKHVYKRKNITQFSIESEPLSVLQSMLDLFKSFDVTDLQDRDSFFTKDHFDAWCNFLQKRLNKYLETIT